jgi:hypothetical protein
MQPFIAQGFNSAQAYALAQLGELVSEVAR